MPRGGPRPGAGRPKGALSKTTIEKRQVEAALTERILRATDHLFNAQYALAKGVVHLYRVEEETDGKKKRRKHVLVTDPEEIKRVLDETDGDGGVVGESYYFIATSDPDGRAIDSMFDRVFGKAISKTEVTGPGGGPVQHTVRFVKPKTKAEAAHV